MRGCLNEMRKCEKSNGENNLQMALRWDCGCEKTPLFPRGILRSREKPPGIQQTYEGNGVGGKSSKTELERVNTFIGLILHRIPNEP